MNRKGIKLKKVNFIEKRLNDIFVNEIKLIKDEHLVCVSRLWFVKQSFLASEVGQQFDKINRINRILLFKFQ
jgi:hypothetical protein